MRKKIEITILPNLEAVDAALKRRCEIQRELDLINMVMVEQIEAAKSKAEAEMKPLHHEAEILEASIEQYAIHHKEEFDMTRSKVLTFGTIGFRKTPGAFRPLAKWNWEQILLKIQDMGLTNFIRYKPSLDKEALEKAYKSHDIDDESLSIMGLKFEQKDEFYFELKKEAISYKDETCLEKS